MYMYIYLVSYIHSSTHHLFQATRELGRRLSPDVRQIDIDVLRTFRNHIMYRERYGIKQQALFHVLVAYSMYNPVSILEYTRM